MSAGTLDRALADYSKAHAKVVEAMMATFPVGTRVRWKHGHHWRYGRVSSHTTWGHWMDVHLTHDSGARSCKRVTDIEAA